LLLVGDGPERQALLAHAAARDVAHRVTITGVVERDDIARHVAAFDIALQPGVTAYASPLKLFEYMHMGRAVVAPDTANIREILTDGHDALLFDPAQPDRMTASIVRLAEHSELRQQLGCNARATIMRRGLTWSRNAATVVKLAESALTRAPALVN